MIEIGLLDGHYWARDTSGSGRWWRLGQTWGLFPTCACPQNKFAPECKHTAAYLTYRAKELVMPKTTEPGTALVPARVDATRAIAETKRQVLALGRAGYDDALYLAEGFCAAGLYGLAPKDKIGAAIIIMTAADLDIPASQAFQYIAIVKGKPMLMARMVGALVWRSGKGKLITIKRQADRAVIRAIRDDQQADFEITMQMAAAAGWTSNALYKSLPANMLWARAVTTAGWAMFPDVLAGMDMVEGGEALEGFSPDEAYQTPTVVAEEQPEDMGPPPAPEAPAAEEKPHDGEYREIPETPAPPQEDAPASESHRPPADDQQWIEELSEMCQALPDKKGWADVAAALGTPKSKKAFIEWRQGRADITDHIAWIRDRLLGIPEQRQPTLGEELPE